MSDVIAQARVVYEQLQDRALAESPLAGMGEWVRSGRPPPSAVFRAAGLTCEGAANAADLRLARKAFTREWGFSIPCAEAVDSLRSLGPLVELGAGSGYWTALLQAAGLDIVATDPAPRANPHRLITGRWASVEPLSATEALARYPGRAVFCSWPTQDAGWLAEALAARLPEAVAIIGDERGGITGNDALFDLLESRFSLAAAVAIPQFPQVSDRLTVWQRTVLGS